MMKTYTREKSEQAFARAQKRIPGGVNSPVRAFKSVGGSPIFMAKAQGSHLWDIDGQRYVDYVGSWGPAIVGHAHPEVVDEISRVARDGLTFGAPTERESQYAERISSLIPSIEMLRLVSSGTEACMAVLRLARAFTKREKIVKFTGCYHGHADMLLVSAGSGAATLGLPDSPGVTKGAAAGTLTLPFNDVVALEELFSVHGNDIAAVILEPIIGNGGFIRPVSGFLESLTTIAHKYGALVVFDEVMTGFRVAWGGAQTLFNITPDLSTFGKVVGGGLPLAFYGGRRDIMHMIAPSGPVYQAGTLSGNPLAVAAGLKTLEILGRPKAFAELTLRTSQLVNGFNEIASSLRIPFIADSEGGMFGLFFLPPGAKGPIRSFEEAKKTDVERFKAFFTGMLAGGTYLAPSAFEAGFVSLAHTDADIAQTLETATHVMKELT